jgi:hypothetical protein
VLEPQIRLHDRAGWRARAFVLALTGDVDGARKAVAAVMPGQAGALEPFLLRLPQLGPADRAMAVHFGRFPAAATHMAVVASPPAATQIASAEPVKARAPGRRAIKEARPDTRRGNDLRDQRADAMGLPRPSAAKIAEAAPRKADPAPPPAALIQAAPAAIMAEAAPVPAPPKVDTRPIETATLAASDATGTVRAPGPQYEAPGPQYELPARVARPVVSTPAISTPAPEPARSRFADVAAAIAALPDVVEVDAPPAVKKPAAMPVKPAAKPAKTVKPEAKPDAKAAAKEKVPPKKAPEPARIWVQLASGANKAALPAEYKRIAAKAPKILGGKTAWTAPSRVSNRLLIGPFKTDKEARDIVNELAKANVNGFSWSSEAGEEIAKLSSK